MGKEPKQLRRGKAFHKEVQSDWEATAEGDIDTESAVTKPSGRSGRIDIFVVADDDIAAVVEIKASDWDRMTDKAVARNVRRQIRQIWSYIEPKLEEGATVCPGVIFQARPASAERLVLIEHLFEEEGISVVWEDETIDERKARSETDPGPPV